MKGPFCLIVIGQCPFNVRNRPLLSSCEGMMKHGPTVFVDFFKISLPCTCTVTPSFDGDLVVFSRKAEAKYTCDTEVVVQNTSIIGCPTYDMSFLFLNVTINQTVDVRARFVSPSKSGTFQHCMGFQRSGGIDGNLKVICGSPSETTVTTIASSTPIITSPIEPSTSVAVNNKKTDATRSSNTGKISFDSLLVESTQDDSDMIYIIAGSAVGGAILLVGLVVVILNLIKMKRSRSAENKERSSEVDKVHKAEIFDSNPELPNNLLYLSLQPLDEFEINSNYDVLLINKPIDHGGSSMPVTDVPKRSRDDTPEVSAGDVYVNL